jgi:hypothetical protein
VKPERALAARNPSGRVENKQTQVVRRGNLKRSVLNDSNRPVRTRMPGGVGGVGQVTWPPLSRRDSHGLFFALGMGASAGDLSRMVSGPMVFTQLYIGLTAANP